MATLAARFKQTLGDKVSDVRASTRLATSAVCLVAPDIGPRPAARKDPVARRRDQDARGAGARAQPDARADQGARRQGGGGRRRPTLDDAAVILYGEARILDGEAPDDPADHAARVARLIEKSLAMAP